MNRNAFAQKFEGAQVLERCVVSNFFASSSKNNGRSEAHGQQVPSGYKAVASVSSQTAENRDFLSSLKT
jgi:hypothetical protein